MKSRNLLTRLHKNSITSFSVVIAGLALVLTIAWLKTPTQAQADSSNNALVVHVQASQGFAVPGNSLPAHILVLITDRSGAPVTDLDQSAFRVINHFGLPGQLCGFSNSISSFGDIGTGAYQIRVVPSVAGCTWVAGDYLAQIVVTDGLMQGQAAATLSIK